MYALLLLILFPILYHRNRTWYFIYAILFFLIGKFIAFKLGVWYAMIIHNVFFVGVLIPFITDKSYRKYYMTVLIWTVIYVAYLYFLHVIHGNVFRSDLTGNFRILFVFMLAVEAVESMRRDKIDLAYFVKAFKYILIFEIVLCWMQYFFHGFGNFFRIDDFTWHGEDMTISGNSEEALENNLCFGTLMKASTFANYLAFNIIVLFLAKQKTRFRVNDYIILAFCVVTLLITGIRAPFLVMLLMLYFILMRGKKLSMKLLYLAAGIVVALVFLPVLSSLGSQGSLESLDNTVLRTLNVFTQLETGSFSEESTFTWPLSMIPYIAQHPLLGNGLHYGNGYFMVLNMRVLEDVSLSDAGFFFYWAEYGLIGLLVFFFFYHYIIKIGHLYGIDKSDLRFLVITLFLLSIVDCSVIEFSCITVFAIASIVIVYYQNLTASKYM